MNESRGAFLAETKRAREERCLERRRHHSAVVIQSWFRGVLARRQLLKEANDAFDQLFGEEFSAEKCAQLDALTAFNCIRTQLSLAPSNDSKRFKIICRYIVCSAVSSDSLSGSYVALALRPRCAVAWLTHISQLLERCRQQLHQLHSCHEISLPLNFLLSLSGADSWRVLCCSKQAHLRPVLVKLAATLLARLVQAGLYSTLHHVLVTSLSEGVLTLTPAQLSAVIKLALRPITAGHQLNSNNCLDQLLLHVFSAPLLVSSVIGCLEQPLERLGGMALLNTVLAHLSDESRAECLLDAVAPPLALFLLANTAQLLHYRTVQQQQQQQPPPQSAATVPLGLLSFFARLLRRVGGLAAARDCPVSQWHSVLGWLRCDPPLSARLLGALPATRHQLRLLWCPPLQQLLCQAAGFVSPTAAASDQPPPAATTTTAAASSAGASRSKTVVPFWKRSSVLGSRHSRLSDSLQQQQWSAAASLCRLHQMALRTLTQMHTEILSNLCFSSTFLPDLWWLMCRLGDNCGLKEWCSLLCANATGEYSSVDQLAVLCVFCELMANYIILLDDEEMYTEQRLFTVADYVRMSSLLNMLVYKMITSEAIDGERLGECELFASVLSLLRVLYGRDCRRRFVQDQHWLIGELKHCSIHDSAKSKQPTLLLLRSVPHVFAHRERVRLLREEVAREKGVLGAVSTPFSVPQSTLITVHRCRLLEDGYRQLARMSPHLLKGCVRVKFVNQQGLDEAGIDQDGVFKEFLEETIRLVFEPSLNLFSANSQHELYPSPSSTVHADHLQLFEFVGKMLAKAVYEGMVVDVPFAQFFLSELLGHSNQRLYCSLDELPSLDPELYKNIIYIKKYDGDVQELGLTFSYDEEVLGEVVTHDLIPGGRTVSVTNENKISYVYSLAHFRMRTQIASQTAAFIRGFRALIRPEWTMIFSASELQRLISGENGELDVRELRRYTQYYGGFHDKHRVINWFWQVLDKDFSHNEKRLFLKFVTACSKPPLMGFAHLQPPFSIRCVELSDDEDRGDTFGSMLRGFFSVHRRQSVSRLPTSSTCFNMLKLPHYDRKATLREKLRYSISSNTGFELS